MWAFHQGQRPCGDGARVGCADQEVLAAVAVEVEGGHGVGVPWHPLLGQRGVVLTQERDAVGRLDGIQLIKEVGMAKEEMHAAIGGAGELAVPAGVSWRPDSDVRESVPVEVADVCQ